MDGEKTRGADARKVRRLLKPARLDRRLSLTPPISVASLSSADTHETIGLNTHFRESKLPKSKMSCLTSRDRRHGCQRLVSPYLPGARLLSTPLLHVDPGFEGVVAQHVDADELARPDAYGSRCLIMGST